MIQPKTYRTILVDDEELALIRLRRLLSQHADRIDILDTAAGLDEAVTKINGMQPDLIFLDIKLGDRTGFELVEKLQKLPAIIFSTAYDEFALKAFDANAVDYLLKPVAPERLNKAIQKLDQRDTRNEAYLRDELAVLRTQLVANPPKKFRIKQGDRLKFLDLDTIYFFRALDKYVEVCTLEQRYLISRSLTDLEHELSVSGFMRTHRGILVNGRYIDEIGKVMNGSYFVRLKDWPKLHLPLSRKARIKLGLG